MGDMDPFVFTLDILIPEITDLPDSESGGIHKSNHRLNFDIGDGIDKVKGFFLGRDIGKVSIKLPHRDLCRVPGLMKYVEGEETDLRDCTIDGTVRKAA